MALATATSCGGARASKREVPPGWPPALPTAAVEAPTTSPAASAVSETTDHGPTGCRIPRPIDLSRTNGIRFAYRAFGRKPGVPFLLLAPFRGTMDSWDPRLTDALARGRPLILFDNAGVGLSSGDAPTTVAEMATDAEAFVDALRELPLHRFRLALRARRRPRVLAWRVRRSTARAESSGHHRPCGSCRHGASGRRGLRNALPEMTKSQTRRPADAATMFSSFSSRGARRARPQGEPSLRGSALAKETATFLSPPRRRLRSSRP